MITPFNPIAKLFGLIIAVIATSQTLSRCVAMPTYDDEVICRVYAMKVEIKAGLKEESHYECEAQSDMMYYSLYLPEAFVAQHPQLDAGETIIAIQNAKVVEERGDREAYIDYPYGAQITILAQSPQRRLVTADATKYKTVGIRTILMVRVTSSDSQVTLSREQLAARTLGTGFGAEPVNAISQIKSCSFGKLQFVQAVGQGIKNGVIEAFVPRNFSAVNWNSFRNELYTPIKAIFGDDLSLLFDHIMFCLPPTSLYLGKNTWLGAALVGHWASFFNDQRCGQLSVFMHELGHNIGLSHSSANSQEYGDTSCIMGYASAAVGGPSYCFNGQKNWWLNWYEDRRVEISGQRAWTGKLAAFTDYDETIQGDHVVIVKVGNYYLQYNKAKKFNAGTVGSRNLITITSLMANGLSNLTGTMGFNFTNATSIFYINSFLDTPYTMVIEACDRGAGTLDYITLSAHLNNGFQKSYCRGGVQTDETPTQSPSSTPSFRRPSVSPSRSPSWTASVLPSAEPTTSSSQPSTSANPSISNDPSVSGVPSTSPTGKKRCEDNWEALFLVDGGRWKTWRDCVWLSKSISWQHKLCRKSLHHAARDACPELCGACSDHCTDDDMFAIRVHGQTVGCDWISIRPGMATNLCKRNAVANACKETCNTCSDTENSVAG